jgi:P4 family phage/plasmid primase-like protien
MSSEGALYSFLRRFKAKENENITHTRIGNPELNIYGGKYSIPDEQLDNLYKYYNKHVFTAKKLEFLTEVQKSVGPILVDLDFRFNPDIEERIITDDHIQDFLELYVEKINQIIKVEGEFNVFVFQKDGVNLLDDKTKDGIHIIFGINVDHSAQLLLREKVLTGISNVIEGLPLTNTKEDVVDIAITRGTNPWQMYGSCKPGNDKYKITKYYKYTPKEQGGFDWETQSTHHSLSLLKAVSAHNTKNPIGEIKDSFKDEYEKIKTKSNKPKRKIYPNRSNVNNINIGSIDSVETLRKTVEEKVEKLPHQEYNMKETYQFVMSLGENFYNPYEQWIRVGWALYNTANTLLSFLIWMAFSSKSDKFNISDMDAHIERWKNMRNDGEDSRCLTNRSIMYWAKMDNPQEYSVIKKTTIRYYMEQTANGCTEFDIANVLYQLYKDQYRCASVKSNTWYEFKNHRWKLIDSGTTLRQKISQELCPMYMMEVSKMTDIFHQNDENDEMSQTLMKRCKKYSEIGLMLKKTNHKQHIMRECCELFYEEKFSEKLDKNQYLMCFNNGVIDFKEKTFRDGMPEDYLSISTNTNYVEFDNKNTGHVKIMNEIVTFMEQLFPVAELNKYMWQHLASVLLGTNENQTFNIYTGSGCNGKSKLVELMEMVLGDYKGSVPITLVTAKRNSIGSCSPEVALLQGRRYAVMQEPSVGDRINEGIMKEITGGDPIQGRALYKDTVTYVPQFSLVVCTNTLFEISSHEDGTWRRIRLVDFMSKFTEKPDPNKKYQFKIDKKIKTKFESWVPIFTSMLVNKAFETDGNVEDCDIVMNKSNQYRHDQDFVAQFCLERIIPDDEGIIKSTEVWGEFQQWYTSNYGSKDKPKAKGLYEYINKNYGEREKGRPWKGIRLLYEGDIEE